MFVCFFFFLYKKVSLCSLASVVRPDHIASRGHGDRHTPHPKRGRQYGNGTSSPFPAIYREPACGVVSASTARLDRSQRRTPVEKKLI